MRPHSPVIARLRSSRGNLVPHTEIASSALRPPRDDEEVQEAEEELEKAASRYEKERSGRGRRFLAEVADTIEGGNGAKHLDHTRRRTCPTVDKLLREMKTMASHSEPGLLDVVALLSDLPEHGIVRGQVGTVVERLDGAYEIEFSDNEGKTYAELALTPAQLLVLHHQPLRAA